MSDHDPKPSLESVEARLAAAREATAKETAKETGRAGSSRGMGLGMRIGMELLVSVLAGVGLGLVLDRWLETTPIFTLAFVSLGFAAGVMNVVRVSRGLDEKIGLGRAVREKEAAETVAGKNTPASQGSIPGAWDDDDDDDD